MEDKKTPSRPAIKKVFSYMDFINKASLNIKQEPVHQVKPASKQDYRRKFGFSY